MEARRRSRVHRSPRSTSTRRRTRPGPTPPARAAGRSPARRPAPLGHADRRRPGRPHGDHRAGDGRPRAGRGRHVHRLLVARHRAWPRARRQAPVLRRQRGVDGHGPRRRGSTPGVADRIELEIGPGVDTLRALPPEEQFDFAFIDADKPGVPRVLRGDPPAAPARRADPDRQHAAGRPRASIAVERRRERHRDPRPQRRHRGGRPREASCCCRSATASAWSRSSRPRARRRPAIRWPTLAQR